MVSRRVVKRSVGCSTVTMRSGSASRLTMSTDLFVVCPLPPTSARLFCGERLTPAPVNSAVSWGAERICEAAGDTKATTRQSTPMPLALADRNLVADFISAKDCSQWQKQGQGRASPIAWPYGVPSEELFELDYFVADHAHFFDRYRTHSHEGLR